ncbi:MAG: flagellar basal body rod protein FlgB [Candidatus Hydrogenedens sp.]
MVNGIGKISAETMLISAMKVAEINHRYIANNIANADTPGYTQKELDFQKSLNAVLQGRGGIVLRTNHPRHIQVEKEGVVVEKRKNVLKNDFNSVDIDEQITKLTENTGKVTVYTALLAKRFNQLTTIINDLKR